MLNRNFANLIIGNCSSVTSSKRYSVKLKDGTEKNDLYYGYCSTSYYLSNFSTLKISQNQQNPFSTFSIGASDIKGTETEEFTRYNLLDELDLTDFNILSASNTEDRTMNASSTFVQVWQYNGSTEKVINEIGLFCATDGNTSASKFMLDRTVLDSPITVENGDTFTISLTIGGKATVTVNSNAA